MKELCVSAAEAGQRLDKYLGRYLPLAEKSFLYKMLRKKNITLNAKKAQGNELVAVGDVVRIWFSDETYEKFSGQQNAAKEAVLEQAYPYIPLEILYEDAHVILINKPAGMLSQKAKDTDRSLCEYLIGYLLHSGQITPQDLVRFRPSVCNRLDRNTSGIVACGKTMAGLAALSELFRDRSLHKYYLCLVDGAVREEAKLDGYLIKDEKTNQVMISPEAGRDGKRIITYYRPLMSVDTRCDKSKQQARAGATDNGERIRVSAADAPKRMGAAAVDNSEKKKVTALEVLLVTGRSHQIRAHLASDGHPIIGDPKYGSERLNEHYRRGYGTRRQLLHCMRVEMPKLEGALAGLSEKTIYAPVPEDFLRIMPQLGEG